MNPFDVVRAAWVDAVEKSFIGVTFSPQQLLDLNPVIAVSQELVDACLKEFSPDLKPLGEYKNETGLILAGKDCVVDPNLKGLSAYTRY